MQLGVDLAHLPKRPHAALDRRPPERQAGDGGKRKTDDDFDLVPLRQGHRLRFVLQVDRRRPAEESEHHEDVFSSPAKQLGLGTLNGSSSSVATTSA